MTMKITADKTQPPHSLPPGDDSGGNRRAWSVVFVLTIDYAQARSRYEHLADEVGGSILNLRGTGAFCVRAVGFMDTALADAVAAVKASSDAALPFDVVETRMVSIDDALQNMDAGRTVTYYTVTHCAAALGVSPQRARQLLKAHQLPTPDAYAGDTPLWEPASFERFAAARKAALGAVPLGTHWQHLQSAMSSATASGRSFAPTRDDDTAVLAGGRKATPKDLRALRKRLGSKD